MKTWLRLSLVAVLVAFPAAAQPFGPGRPPPGVNDFRAIARRAEWVRDSVLKLAPKANARCVYAVALEMVGLAELAWSDSVAERGKRPRTVRKGEAQAFKDSLRMNAQEECRDDNGRGPPSPTLYETVKGLLSFASDQEDWMSANYDRLRRDVVRAAEGLIKLGALVPATEGGSLALPTVSLPILNPELFMPRQEDKATRL